MSNYPSSVLWRSIYQVKIVSFFCFLRAKSNFHKFLCHLPLTTPPSSHSPLSWSYRHIIVPPTCVKWGIPSHPHTSCSSHLFLWVTRLAPFGNSYFRFGITSLWKPLLTTQSHLQVIFCHISGLLFSIIGVVHHVSLNPLQSLTVFRSFPSFCWPCQFWGVFGILQNFILHFPILDGVLFLL